METAEPIPNKLYSPAQVAVASFVGTPMAACWFLARNYRQLGHPGTANRCVLWGVVGTVALIVAAYFIPDEFPSLPIPLGYTVGLLMAARKVHGNTVSQHLSAGGRLGSWWAVIAMSVLFLVIILVVMIGVDMALPEEEIPDSL